MNEGKQCPLCKEFQCRHIKTFNALAIIKFKIIRKSLNSSLELCNGLIPFINKGNIKHTVSNISWNLKKAVQELDDIINKN